MTDVPSEHDLNGLTQAMLDADPTVQEVMPGIRLDAFKAMTHALLAVAERESVTFEGLPDLLGESEDLRRAWADQLPTAATSSPSREFNFDTVDAALPVARDWYFQAAQAIHARRSTLPPAIHAAERRALQMAADRINSGDLATITAGTRTLYHLATTGDILFF